MEEYNRHLLLECSRDTEGESPSGRPAKRKKKSDRYQGFGPEEKKQLKDYETWESQARKIVKRTYGILFEDLSPDDTQIEITYLKKRLSTLKNKTSLDPICIGFLGRTGAGKTSLLNAILGKKLFLPVSGNSACTSCVVKVTTSRADQYEATIHLISDNEWKEEMKKLVEVLSKNGDDDDDDDDSHECVKDATEKLCAVYGEGAEEKDFETLSKTKMQVTVPPGLKITIKAQEAEDLSQKLDPYIRVRDEGTDGLWPLIKYVEVTIPGSDTLPEGIVFFDIPGTGDFNSKRDEMWKQSIHGCSVIWIISDIERVLGEKVQTELLNASIKACLSSICTDIALVVTKSDKLEFEEYRRERKNKNFPVENEHDAILERNQDVKTTKQKYIKEKLKKRLPPESEIPEKSKLVYTVSAKEFWEPKHLSPDETEIPELREYIRKICLKEKQKLVTDYVDEIRSIHRLAKNFFSEPQLEGPMFQESVAEGLMNDVDSLEKDLEKCFGEIEKPLSEGVDHARKNFNKTITNLLTRDKGYRGFHKTLKAVCLKDGVYASKILARIDFNESLAELIHSKTDGIFDSIFRTQNPTRSSLWPYLEMFKTEMQRKIHRIGEDKSLQSNSKIENFIQETNIILKQLGKEILQKKLDIYKSLWVSIQNDLKPHYHEASKLKGPGSCDQMKTVLSEGIKHEILNKMFERAKSKMESQFQELKTYIVQTLKEHISIVFNLVFSQQERTAMHLAATEVNDFMPDLVREQASEPNSTPEQVEDVITNKELAQMVFPDIKTECTEIDEIYDNLQMNS